MISDEWTNVSTTLQQGYELCYEFVTRMIMIVKLQVMMAPRRVTVMQGRDTELAGGGCAGGTI